MSFTLGHKDDTHSVYSTDYGELRIRDREILAGRLPRWLPVGELWEQFTDAISHSLIWVPSSAQEGLFLEYAVAIGIDPADITYCGSCDKPRWNNDDSFRETTDGQRCGQCVDDLYTECQHCEDLYLTSELESSGRRVPDGDGQLTCWSCISNHYAFCEECNQWFDNDEAGEHDHEDEEDDEDTSTGCCSSPQLSFKVRNGTAMLASDTRAEVALPAKISPEGISLIKTLLREQDNSLFRDLANYYLPEPEWQTRSGNFTKRLSSAAYKMLQLKVPPAVMAQVGTIARDHSRAGSLHVEVTRKLNLPSYAFANGGSCWWGGYSDSRCALKSNGGFGLRSFSESSNEVTGRAWVMPLKLVRDRLTPTFDTEKPAAFIVFNGYGDLDGYTACRIVAQMAGWTYSRISGFECAPMYVNSGGYLVAAEETVRKFPELELSVSRHSYLYQDEIRESEMRKELLSHVS
jgi:hypothetical protein